MIDTAPLFRPCTVGRLNLRNRFVMAPMTRFYAPGGVPTAINAAYYRRRVEGGLGLIVTEGTFIEHRSACQNTTIPRFYGGDALSGWQLVVDEVHAAGGKIFPQLWHVGAQRKAGEGFYPDAPSMSASGLVWPGQAAGIAMTGADIEDVVNAYAQGATDAQRLGFDGVELHAAHGYLIDQFFWSGTNIREDGYGGSIAGRTRFGVEIVKEIRRRVGPAFPICLRYSQWKLPDYKARLANCPQELEEFLGPLVLAGVDIFHCSVRRFWDPAFEGWDDTLAAWTKKLSGKAVITVGSIGLAQEFIPGTHRNSDPMGIDRVAELFEKGAFDLAAVGRVVLANPDWANKMRTGAIQELRSFVPSTIRSYANPTVSHDLL